MFTSVIDQILLNGRLMRTRNSRLVVSAARHGGSHVSDSRVQPFVLRYLLGEAI